MMVESNSANEKKSETFPRSSGSKRKSNLKMEQQHIGSIAFGSQGSVRNGKIVPEDSSDGNSNYASN